MNPITTTKHATEASELDPNAEQRRPMTLTPGLGGALVRPEPLGANYSYRSIASLSKRGQDKTWPATAQ